MLSLLAWAQAAVLCRRWSAHVRERMWESACAGAVIGCLMLRQRRRRRDDRKSLKPSPSTPAVPPPTSPVARQRSFDRAASGGGSSFTSVGNRPRSQTEMERQGSGGKTNVIPYSQYRKSRLDSIRNDLGLQGEQMASCLVLTLNCLRHSVQPVSCVGARYAQGLPHAASRVHCVDE